MSRFYLEYWRGRFGPEKREIFVVGINKRKRSVCVSPVDLRKAEEVTTIGGGWSKTTKMKNPSRERVV